MSAIPILDLVSIRQSLRSIRDAPPALSGGTLRPVPLFDDEVTAHLLLGYAMVDQLVAEDVDPLALGNSHYLLELNARVLCGTDEGQRRMLADHLDATRERFYDQVGGGIGGLVEWYRLNRHRPLWHLAAGLFMEVVSQPQLFIEGNHRTGLLLMNWVLLRAGQPPFVLSPDNTVEFFAAADTLSACRRRGLFRLLPERRALDALVTLIRAQAQEGQWHML
jgi:hypothetical protein